MRCGILILHLRSWSSRWIAMLPLARLCTSPTTPERTTVPRNPTQFGTMEGGGNTVGDRVEDTSSSIMFAAYICFVLKHEVGSIFAVPL